MRSTLCLAAPLCFVAALALAQPRASGGPCRDACERYVKEPLTRAAVCGKCLLGAQDRGAWVLALVDTEPNATALGEMLGDDDWGVRWGAVRGLAKVRGVLDLRQLATWTIEAKGDSATLACDTALHVAGERKETTAQTLGKGGALGPSAAALCWQKRDVLRARLEKALYAQEAWARREALRHLAAFLSLTPARVALDAMKGRPAQGDEILARLLIDEAQNGGPPVGRALLTAVGKNETALADRLLMYLAPRVDAERPRLASADENERRGAVSELSNLGPLGARELEGMLGDASLRVALAAARALARGEGLTMTALVQKQLAPETQATEAARLRWISMLGKSQEKDCSPLLSALVADARSSDALRAAGAVAWAGCAEHEAMPQLKVLAGAKSPVLRAAAVDAVAQLPRSAQAPELVAGAFKDPEPIVQAAAARAAGALRMAGRAPQLVAMLETGKGEVRQAAAESLAVLRTPQGVTTLAKVLQSDPEEKVRLACAQALGEAGGPEAMGALTRAAQSDASPKVKLAATASLRRLGFEPSKGTLRQ